VETSRRQGSSRRTKEEKKLLSVELGSSILKDIGGGERSSLREVIPKKRGKKGRIVKVAKEEKKYRE